MSRYMSQPDYVELNFRYRPKEHSNDAALVSYLNSHSAKEKRKMILKALRHMYLLDAVCFNSKIETVEDLSRVAQALKKTYGSNEFKKSFSLDISINMVSSFSESPNYDPLDDASTEKQE